MASSDQDPEIEKRKAQAFDRLLAESLSSSGARKADCPDAETLAAFYERALDPAETAQWRAHFAGCSRCQQALAAMAASDPNPLAADEIERLGELVAAASAPQAVAPRTRAWKLPWHFDPRTLVPLAAAAVFAVALWITINPSRVVAPELALAPPPSVGEPMIAENKSARQPPGAPSAAPSGAANERQALPAPAGNAAPVAAAQPAPSAAPQQSQSQQAQAANSESAEQTVIVAPAQMPAPEPAPSDSAAAANATSSAAPGTAAPGGAEQSSAAPVTGGAIAGMMASNASSSAQYMRAKALGFRPGDLVVAATNPQIVWRFGPRGHIERSTDGGNTWTPESSPVQADLLAGSAPSETVCWIVGRSGTILRSTDGLTWQIVPSPKPAEQNFQPPDWISVDAHDAQSAVIRTQDGRGFSTSDAGKTWRPR
jgi:hypothetical protein